MLNFNPNANADSGAALRRNLRAVERHINNDHYVRSFGPGDMVYEATAATGVVGRWGVGVLPALADTSALITFERPSEWASGKLKITLRSSAPVAAATNYRIFLQGTVAKPGSVMTATTLILNDVATAPGPAVANTRVDRIAYSTSNVTQEFDIVSIKVIRTGTNIADTNPNAFHIYSVRVEFIPAMQEADVR